MPPGTPPGFPVTKICRKHGTELDVPFAQGLVTDLDTALVQHFLTIYLAYMLAAVQSDGVLDDCHGKTVAVRLGFVHGGSACPKPVKAVHPKFLLRFERA